MLTAISPQAAPTLSKQPDRFYALDAVRAFALILGIFFHGTMSFVSYIGYFWAVRDSQPSVFLDGFFYIAHSFRMQAFFLIAGYFAHLLYHRQGPKGFLTHRVRRILVPFLIFLPIIYALVVALWVWGYQNMGVYPKGSPLATLSPLLIMVGDITSLNWFRADMPTAHLWFLYYLILFCLGVLVVRPLVDRIDASERIRTKLDNVLNKVAQRWWGSLGLGALMVLPMQSVTDWVGVNTPAGFIPGLASLSVYGLYFTFGWFFHRQPELINELKRYWQINLLISLGLLGGLTFFFLTTVYARAAPPTLPAIEPTVVSGFLPITNSIFAFASMSAVFAFIGAILQYFSHPSKRIRYLSDSAYWLYLAHLPVVVLFQILVAPLQIQWLLKLPLIFVPSFTILFLTYHFGVRNTWLGKMLNGQRYPLK